MKKIISVVGTRPNLMKLFPVARALRRVSGLEHVICHTGQHFDAVMRDNFFNDFEMEKPKYLLNITTTDPTAQMAQMMIDLERIFRHEKPDYILIYGDVNSTLIASLIAARLNIPIGHVEAGLRSFDLTMPEEINRIVADRLSSDFFITEPSAERNLRNEGIEAKKIHFVGNTMVDTLLASQPRIASQTIVSDLDLIAKNYVVATFHRPANVDGKTDLKKVVSLLNKLAEVKEVIFPAHPRTKKNLEDFHLLAALSQRIILTEPLGYYQFMSLISQSILVVTDSGGIQEETTFLRVPAITFRTTTERPITTTVGSNVLVGDNVDLALKVANEIFNNQAKKSAIPSKWDGRSAMRIVRYLKKSLG